MGSWMVRWGRRAAAVCGVPFSCVFFVVFDVGIVQFLDKIADVQVVCMSWCASATDHGEIAKMMQLVHCVAEQIVVFSTIDHGKS